MSRSGPLSIRAREALTGHVLGNGAKLTELDAILILKRIYDAGLVIISKPGQRIPYSTKPDDGSAA